MNAESWVLVILIVVLPQSQGVTYYILYSATVGVPEFCTITSKNGVELVKVGGVIAGCSTTRSVSQAIVGQEKYVNLNSFEQLSPLGASHN